MAERRASARFELVAPRDVGVRVLRDMRLLESGPQHMIVLSSAPAIRGEVVEVHRGSPSGGDAPYTATVTGSGPRVVADQVMHAVRLELEAPLSSRMPGEAFDGQGAFVQLARTHVARVRNLGRGGCLLEFQASLSVGTVGTLVDATDLSDSVRIAHVRRSRGGSFPYSVGVEFLPVHSATPSSLRETASRLEVTHGEASAFTSTWRPRAMSD